MVQVVTPIKPDTVQDTSERPMKNIIAILSVIFAASFSGLVFIYTMFPELDESEKESIKIPFNLDDAKALGLVLAKYKSEHFFEVLIGIMLAYIFLQTFAIPGSLFLSILSGYLFNFWTAIALICFCSALGATLCFIVSQHFGRRLVTHYFPMKVKSWAQQVEKHRSDLFSYMLFLRMTPFLPNWFINLTAPIIGVPLMPFVFGTFFGVAPPSFIAIEAGKTLYKMSSSSEAFSTRSITTLTVFSILALVPVIFKRYFKSKLD